ncbi:MAG: NYN domain-containing protein [Zoogloea sp.]|uniref:NYN domain-containing protein n=1 Tax=Zoogloea sp. TaxID=49181 RepID=UPI00262EE239|nr:NYN domain-containing protein [Zoogloea sp.]MDD3326228.1 NYN domain-containing protein [Zoogloea sp.]
MASSPDSISMALFCDFENVALGVRDAKYEKFDIKLVLERLLLKGSIVVKKAYCDWERYKGFKAAMHEANFELIEIPHVRQSGKNSADIRLVVDALDLCYTKSHVDTFVIISGDSDFSPLVSKLRENAKQVIGVGVKQSTSDLLIANCDEFIFYDDLVRETRHASARPEPREAQAPSPRRSSEEEKRRREELDSRRTRAVTMAVETCDALIAERGDTGKIWASMLKDAIKRRQPGFNESYFGFKAFGNLLDEAQARGLLEVGRDEKSGTFVTRAGGHLKAEPVAVEPVASDEPAVEAAPAESRRPSRRSGRGGRKAAPAPELVAEAPLEPIVEAAPAAEPEPEAKPDAEPAKPERRRKGRRSTKAEETPASETLVPVAEPAPEAPAAAPKKARSSRKKADKKPEAAEAVVLAAEAPADAAPKKTRSRRAKKTEEKTED